MQLASNNCCREIHNATICVKCKFSRINIWTAPASYFAFFVNIHMYAVIFISKIVFKYTKKRFWNFFLSKITHPIPMQWWCNKFARAFINMAYSTVNSHCHNSSTGSERRQIPQCRLYLLADQGEVGRVEEEDQVLPLKD